MKSNGSEQSILEWLGTQQGAMLVDDASIFVDHLYRHHTLRSCQRDAEAGVHIFGDARGCATQRHQSLAGHGLMFWNGQRRSTILERDPWLLRRVWLMLQVRSVSGRWRTRLWGTATVSIEDFFPTFVDVLPVA